MQVSEAETESLLLGEDHFAQVVSHEELPQQEKSSLACEEDQERSSLQEALVYALPDKLAVIGYYRSCLEGESRVRYRNQDHVCPLVALDAAAVLCADHKELVFIQEERDLKDVQQIERLHLVVNITL